MGLSDVLAAAKTKPVAKCAVCQVLERLSIEDRNTLVKVLAVPETDPEFLSSTAISRALASEGYMVGYNSVQRHRRNGHGA